MKADDVIEAAAESLPEPPAPGGGFVIEEVEMKGFMRYVERTEPPVRFPERFTVITGRTGAGKSSILDAITFALYKATTRTDPPANATIDEICRPGGFVRVAFRQGDARYEVKRGFTSKKDPYLELTRDGESIGGTIPEREAAVRDIVGLDYDGFTNSTFVRQEEMKDLGSHRGSKRLEIFQKLFRLETFERAQALAKERFDDVARKLELREEEIRVRTERLQKLPALQEELAALQTEAADLAARADALAAETEVAGVRVRELEALHAEFLKAGAALAETRKRVEDVDRRIGSVSRDAEQTETLQAQISLLEDETKDFEAIQEERERLRELQQRHREALKDREGRYQLRRAAEAEHEKTLKQLTEKLFDRERRVKDLRTDVTKEEAFRLHHEDGALSERVSRIEREVGWLADRKDLLKDLDLERRKSEIQLDEVRRRMEGIGDDSFILSELTKQIEEIKGEVRREDEVHLAQLSEFDAELESIDRQVAKIGFTDDHRKRLSEIENALPRLKPKRDALEEARRRLRTAGDSTKLLEDLKGQRERLATDLATAEGAVTGLRDAETEYEESRKQLEALRKAVEDARVAASRYAATVGERRKAIVELEEDVRRNTEAEERLAHAKGEREVLAILKDQVFHKKGVVMYAVNQILPELEIEASKNLSDLTDARFSKIRLETYEEGKGHGIRILVEGVDGQWHDVGEFSGGEKTQINAALRFAIAKELASMPQVGRTYGRMRTLFIDEGDLGSLDTESSRDLFVRKLFKMGEFFDKVILITHLSEVAERFPGRLRVEMDARQESRIESLS